MAQCPIFRLFLTSVNWALQRLFPINESTRCYTQICCFFSLLVAVYSLPQESFLAPLNDANVAASQVIFSSGFFPEQPSREAVGGAFSVSNGDDDTNIDDEVATLEGSGTVDNKDDDENLGHMMRGSYAYVGADGLPYMVDWGATLEGSGTVDNKDDDE